MLGASACPCARGALAGAHTCPRAPWRAGTAHTCAAGACATRDRAHLQLVIAKEHVGPVVSQGLVDDVVAVALEGPNLAFSGGRGPPYRVRGSPVRAQAGARARAACEPRAVGSTLPVFTGPLQLVRNGSRLAPHAMAAGSLL